jgi:hypothetical protein
VRLKKALALLCALCLAAAWGARVYYVNSTSEKPNIEIYSSNEMVDIGSNFLMVAEENMNGYLVRVNGASVKTLAEFLTEIGQPPDYFQTATAVYIPTYVYDLEVTVRNENSEGSDLAVGINLIGTVLKSANHQIQVHHELFDLLYPQLKGEYGFRVRPGTEMALHFPFTAIRDNAKKRDRAYFETEQFYLILSRYPVQKMIKVDKLR